MLHVRTYHPCVDNLIYKWVIQKIGYISIVRWNPLPISSARWFFSTTKRTFQNWLPFLYIYTCSEIIRYFPTNPGGFGFGEYLPNHVVVHSTERLRHQVWTRPFLYGEYHVVPFQVWKCQIGRRWAPWGVEISPLIMGEDQGETGVK